MSPSLRSTSTRTFVVFPVLAAAEAGWRRRRPHWPFLAVMAGGYTLTTLAARYRAHLGRGGPGMSNPPERLVTSGPYSVSRNPIYLGHLVYVAGSAGVFRSRLVAASLLALLPWYQRRVRRDEQRLRDLFTGEYEDYRLSAPRWLGRPRRP